MKRAGAYEDVKRVIDTKRISTGKAKLRNKRYA
jgi:ribosomal protein L4